MNALIIEVHSPLQAQIVQWQVQVGDNVKAGDVLLILEAMKMEHVHTAPIAGTISAIDVAEGEQVTTGKIVVEIEAEASV